MYITSIKATEFSEKSNILPWIIIISGATISAASIFKILDISNEMMNNYLDIKRDF
jgi:hypothetical protein